MHGRTGAGFYPNLRAELLALRSLSHSSHKSNVWLVARAEKQGLH